jgi:hypothetical protein
MLEKKAPMKWYKNGEEIKSSDRIQIKYHEDGKQQLIISNAQLDDIGEYMCKTKDMKSSCKVNVLEAEKKPVFFLDKTDFQADAGRPFSIEIPYKSKFYF